MPQQLSLELLVCTHNGRTPMVLEQTEVLQRAGFKVTVTNQQIDQPVTVRVTQNFHHFHHFRDRGLSRNRNHALDLASAEVAIFCDNDVQLTESAAQSVREAYAHFPDADIITFQLLREDGSPFRKYAAEAFRHNRRSIFNVREMEVTVRTAAIKRAGLRFNENFGLGTRFPSGEGFLFLHECLQQGLKIYYYPRPLLLHQGESSGATFADLKMLESKGALFRRVFGAWSLPLGLAFLAKKYRQILPYHSLAKAWRAYLTGHREAKSLD